MKKILQIKGKEIAVLSVSGLDYISLTDIARYKNQLEPKVVVQNWIRTRSVIEFLGLWEKINNSNFKGVEFDAFKNEAGSNAFTLSPQKWIEKTSAIGLISKSGRYASGTFAHKDIAFEFASWVSTEFKLYLITEFQRLKDEEGRTKNLEWNVNRVLSKINYHIHTDAIRINLIPPEITKQAARLIYADEADVLNMALFGETAKMWRDKHPNEKGNIRDFASIEQLIVLVNLENLNALFIGQKTSQEERLVRLNKIAISQIKSLLGNSTVKKLK